MILFIHLHISNFRIQLQDITASVRMTSLMVTTFWMWSERVSSVSVMVIASCAMQKLESVRFETLISCPQKGSSQYKFRARTLESTWVNLDYVQSLNNVNGYLSKNLGLTVQFSQNAPAVAHTTLPKSNGTFDALNGFVVCGQGSSPWKVCVHITVVSYHQENADWRKLESNSICAKKSIKYHQTCETMRARACLWFSYHRNNVIFHLILSGTTCSNARIQYY